MLMLTDPLNSSSPNPFHIEEPPISKSISYLGDVDIIFWYWTRGQTVR